MSVNATSHESAHGGSRLRDAAVWAGEFFYVIDILFASLVIAIVVLGGIDPVKSPFIGAFLLVTGISLLVHHVWYARHRTDIEQGHPRHAARERRGF